jgi:hypothetical protein
VASAPLSISRVIVSPVIDVSAAGEHFPSTLVLGTRVLRTGMAPSGCGKQKVSPLTVQAADLRE